MSSLETLQRNQINRIDMRSVGVFPVAPEDLIRENLGILAQGCNSVPPILLSVPKQLRYLRKCSNQCKTRHEQLVPGGSYECLFVQEGEGLKVESQLLNNQLFTGCIWVFF